MEVARGDVVLLAFPFLTVGKVERKLRPEVMRRIDQALDDSLGLAGDSAQTD